MQDPPIRQRVRPTVLFWVWAIATAPPYGAPNTRDDAHVENLSDRLSGVFDRLQKQGALSEPMWKPPYAKCASPSGAGTSRLPLRAFTRPSTKKAMGQARTKSITYNRASSRQDRSHESLSLPCPAKVIRVKLNNRQPALPRS